MAFDECYDLESYECEVARPREVQYFICVFYIKIVDIVGPGVNVKRAIGIISELKKHLLDFLVMLPLFNSPSMISRLWTLKDEYEG